MDVVTITSFRRARTREDLALAPGEAVMAGGTWLMSEPQPRTTGFVDLTTMGWPDVEVSEAGLRIGATCTIETLVEWARGAATPRTAALPPAPADWCALDLASRAANALLASFKIWATATVGGNVCQSFAAAAMVSFAAGLDGVAHCWAADGTDRRLPVADLITGNARNALRPGEVLRAVEIPAIALRARTSLHKIALAELGRSGAVVTGRLETPADGGGVVIGITAATRTPVLLRYDALPSADALRRDVEAAPGYYSDPLGPADWRRAVSAVLALRVREDLAGGPGSSGGAVGSGTRVAA
ncbi:FAD binding domain-containing protein [Litorihabitans aurantiacus]|uniref:FAD-binding molybdopterin dehydrogenase n=1 Tax=Litorihabitans aurantiacus TaxID=1930061 RepID=A0AA37UU27_9MICO|nr:FAD binding domain-containing protein [Litorihabitans aurantiacus]GMA30141.1 FAD-binding molybdopterin dehydrogenase [Litorihabitans aurantiacus]